MEDQDPAKVYWLGTPTNAEEQFNLLFITAKRLNWFLNTDGMMSSEVLFFLFLLSSQPRRQNDDLKGYLLLGSRETKMNPSHEKRTANIPNTL